MSEDKSAEEEVEEFLGEDEQPGVSYVKPGYVELVLPSDKKQEARQIVKTISEWGISQRQRLFILYLLSLEFENGHLRDVFATACKDAHDNFELGKAPKKQVIVVDKKPKSKISLG